MRWAIVARLPEYRLSKFRRAQAEAASVELVGDTCSMPREHGGTCEGRSWPLMSNGCRSLSVELKTSG